MIMLLREIKNIFHKELHSIYPKEEVASFFYLLIENFLGFERFILALRPDLVISKEEEQPLFEALADLRLERPIQYIIGKAHFMDMDFMVNENVLIPRPETEELVRWVITDCTIDKGSDLKILDVGTGSGCIAIALAKNLPHSDIYALDISKEALDTAKYNAKANKVEVEFFEADILDNCRFKENIDIIVSNPPYIRNLEKYEINKNVKAYEPGRALFVPDDDPLIFYKAIVDFAIDNLKKGGFLYLEINQYLGNETKQLLKNHNFMDIELRKDIFGNERMLKGVLYP